MLFLCFVFALVSQVGAGAIDLQELIELAYLLAWMYVFWCLGEMYGRGSIYGYRFDGQEHHDEVQNVILFKEAEVLSIWCVLSGFLYLYVWWSLGRRSSTFKLIELR